MMLTFSVVGKGTIFNCVSCYEMSIMIQLVSKSEVHIQCLIMKKTNIGLFWLFFPGMF